MSSIWRTSWGQSSLADWVPGYCPDQTPGFPDRTRAEARPWGKSRWKDWGNWLCPAFYQSRAEGLWPTSDLVGICIFQISFQGSSSTYTESLEWGEMVVSENIFVDNHDAKRWTTIKYRWENFPWRIFFRKHVFSEIKISYLQHIYLAFEYKNMCLRIIPNDPMMILRGGAKIVR